MEAKCLLPAISERPQMAFPMADVALENILASQAYHSIQAAQAANEQAARIRALEAYPFLARSLQ